MSREYRFFSTKSFKIKTLLILMSIVGILGFIVPTSVQAISSAKKEGCVGSSSTLGYISPFSATKEQCLGQDSSLNVTFFQFAVELPIANDSVSITGKNGSGTSIPFVKQNSTLYVSRPDPNDKTAGYMGVVPVVGSTSCNSNDGVNKITITAKAAGKEQTFSINLCENKTAYVIGRTANNLTTGTGGSTAPPPVTGCVQGNIGLFRDDTTPQWTSEQRKAALQKGAVTYLKVDGPTKHELSNNQDIRGASWFELEDGAFAIRNLAPGQYTVTLRYNDKLQIVEDIGPNADTWTSENITFTLKNIRIQAKSECTEYNSGDTLYLSTTTGNPADPDAATEEEDTKASCAIPGVGWILCPVLTLLGEVTDRAYTYIAGSFLEINNDLVSSTSGTNTAWGYMRNIANVIFVVVFLFIIFSQLTGQGIANYGVKKMLPRLIIAAILVNVSFFVCQVAIDLSNILGVSLKNLLEGAGDTFDPVSVATDQSSLTGNWAGIVVAVITGVGIAWALGLPVLIPFLLAAVVAVLMTFFILVLRQVLIVLLVVLAPVALVAFILPNTEQWFTKWRKMFMGLLLVFPTIGLLFGAAALTSSILKTVYGADPSSPDSTSDIIGQMIAHGALVLPLFLLPSLLKASLNSVGSIGAKLNGMSGKVGKGLGSKASNSGVMRALSNNKSVKRAQVGAGIYSGRNPVSKLRSGLNSRLNRSDAFNAVTGNFGTARGANIEKLEEAEIKTAEAAANLKAESSDGPSIEAQYEAAIRKGDLTTAKATQNILMGKGGPGVNAVRDITAKVEAERDATGQSRLTSDMRRGLSSNITSRHAQVAKQKSTDLLSWSTDKGLRSFDTITGDRDTWAKLTATELSGLTDDAFNKAMISGGVSPAVLESLKSERMSGFITEAKRAAIGQHVYTPPVEPAPTPPAGGGTPPPAP